MDRGANRCGKRSRRRQVTGCITLRISDIILILDGDPLKILISVENMLIFMLYKYWLKIEANEAFSGPLEPSVEETMSQWSE